MSQSIYTSHYTYLIINTTNQMKYIGVRSCNCLPENDSDYMGSSKPLDEAMETSPEAFVKTIIDTFPTRKNANADEQRLHEMYDVARNPEFYNQMNAPLGFCNAGNPLSSEHKRKMSEAHKGKTFSPEHKKNISAAQRGEKNHFYGKHHSAETKEKMSAAKKGENHHMYGKKLPSETIKKLSDAQSGKNNPMYGRKHTPEARQKISEAQKGKTLSPAHKKKISESLRGKKKPPFTEEHRRNLSLAYKKRKDTLN